MKYETVIRLVPFFNNSRPEVKTFMMDVLKMLKKDGILLDIDSGALNLLCIEYNRYLDCVETVNKEGATFITANGEIKKHPLTAIINMAIKNCITLIEQLGLGAKSRRKLEANESNESEPKLLKVLKRFGSE